MATELLTPSLDMNAAETSTSFLRGGGNDNNNNNVLDHNNDRPKMTMMDDLNLDLVQMIPEDNKGASSSSSARPKGAIQCQVVPLMPKESNNKGGDDSNTNKDIMSGQKTYTYQEPLKDINNNNCKADKQQDPAEDVGPVLAPTESFRMALAPLQVKNLSHESSSSVTTSSSESNSNSAPQNIRNGNQHKDNDHSPKWKHVEATPKISKVPKLTNAADFIPPPFSSGSCHVLAPLVSSNHRAAGGQLRRSQSTPVGEGGSRGSSRRTIFDSFWKQTEQQEGEDDTQSVNSSRSTTSSSKSGTRNHFNNYQPRRLRSYSCGSFADSSHSRENNANIMMYAPPLEHQSSLHGNFERLEELPLSVHQSLPPLPSPLRRIFQNEHGILGGSGGMYPLSSERPVLHKSVYGPMTLEDLKEHKRQQQLQHQQQQQQSSLKDLQPPMSGAPFTSSSLPLCMTDSIRPQHKKRYMGSHQHQQQHSIQQQGKNNSCNANAGGDGDVTKKGSQDSLLELASTSSSSSTSQTNSHRTIQFDPRVTVTEYDDHIPRQWYSESELEKLKYETIELVQRYLLQHPQLAAEYCTGTVDPVTGVVRKKTLYSLPILNCTDESELAANGEFADTTSSSSQQQQSATPYSRMANIHVRKILIVDPNKLILDLFCKSLRQIFPHAEVTAVQTGDEALYLVKQTFRKGLTQATTPRGFDLVIVEEKLQTLPLRGYGHSPQQVRTTDAIPTKYQHKKSFSAGSPGQLQSAQHSSMSRLADYHKATSCPDSMHPKYLSGSEVLLKIMQIEEEMFRPDRCILEDEEFNEEGQQTNVNDNENGSEGEDEEYQQQVCWRSLLIGVCVDQRHDAERLRMSGADIVWGKPPPHMGELLRNQLVALLVGKRNPSFPNPLY